MDSHCDTANFAALDDFLARNTDVAGVILDNLTQWERAILSVTSHKSRRIVSMHPAGARVPFGPSMTLCTNRLRWHGPLAGFPGKTHLPTAIPGVWQILHNGERKIAFQDPSNLTWREERIDTEPFASGRSPVASLPYKRKGLAKGQVQLVFLTNRRNTARDNNHIIVELPQPMTVGRLIKNEDTAMALALQPPRPPLHKYFWLGPQDTPGQKPSLAAVYDMLMGRSWLDYNFPVGHMFYTGYVWCPDINTLVLCRENRLWCIVLNAAYDSVLFKAFLPPSPTLAAYKGSTLAYNHANGQLYIVGGANRGYRKLDSVWKFPLLDYVQYAISLGASSVDVCMHTTQETISSLSKVFHENNPGAPLTPGFLHAVPRGHTSSLVAAALNDSPYMSRRHDTGTYFVYDRPFTLMIARQDPMVRFIDHGRTMMVAGGTSLNRQRVAQIEFYDVCANRRLNIRCSAPDNAEM